MSYWGSGNSVGNRHLDILGHYVLFCASAGNDNNGHDNKWPACHEPVLAVGAHQADGHKADFSNFQDYVRLSAPGVEIRTTDMVGYTSNGYYKGRADPEDFPWEHVYANGTSYSSPIVAAVAAIVLDTEPSLTPAQLQERLIDSSQPLPNPMEWTNSVEIGRVDAYAAIMWGAQ
ncbi:S8 family serine peptidase [bacterium]|nr:S8 family serine peptidase [bacterium]